MFDVGSFSSYVRLCNFSKQTNCSLIVNSHFTFGNKQILSNQVLRAHMQLLQAIFAFAFETK